MNLPISKKLLKNILIVMACFIGSLILFNAAYFAKQVGFLISPPNPAPIVMATSSQQAIPNCATTNTINIPRLGISAPVMYVDKANEDEFQQALLHGVVHYPGTALPGELGNAYIFGHSSDFRWSTGEYKTIFALLPNIKTGDEIQLTNANGYLFTYQVTGTQIVNPDELWVLDQHGNKDRELTVQTSYPLGTALRRFVAFSKLTSSITTCIIPK